MRIWQHTLAMLILGFGTCSAHAHGIAGNRVFAGTLAFDDPAVADELALPAFSTFNEAVEGGNARDNRIGWAFSRLLTPTLAVSVESGWIHRSWAAGQRSGFDTTNLGIKAEIFRDNRHEMLVAAGLAWGIGRSGASGVGANGPHTIQPGIFFGKGFGDLPDSLAWLRPFAVTGSVAAELPLGRNGPPWRRTRRPAGSRRWWYPRSRRCTGASLSSTAPTT